MKFKKFRWSKVYESSEEELVRFLETRTILAIHWELEALEHPDKRYIDHDVTLWCAEGSFGFVGDGQSLSMQVGDAVKIPAGTTIETNAGISGCICYESANA